MAPETVEFSNAADLILEFTQGATKRRGFVSSASLANASEIWRQTLDRDTALRNLPTELVDGKIFRVLSLPSNYDANALVTIMHILHHKARKVPRSISFEDLVNISFICDKFSLTESLLPWPEFWIEDLVDENSNQGDERWLFISYVFPEIEGAQAQAAGISARLVRECCGWTSKDSTHFVRYVERSDQIILDPKDRSVVRADLMPASLLEEIWNKRKESLAKMVSITEDFYGTMMFHSHGLRNNIPLCSNQSCIDVATGSLIRSMRELNLPIYAPFPANVFTDLPLWLIQSRLMALKCTTILPWSRIDTTGLFKHLFKLPTDDAYYHYQFHSKSNNTTEFSAIFLSDPSEDLSITDPEREGDAEQIYDIGKSDCGVAVKIRQFHEKISTVI
ncbi:hypothetical protein H072_268 [Dactylellina haptotyla CBS 200.50]|uniref:Uncharacterized protein n=1 Tax=Dactylellina haptotyla (strain CBS 200.50) TaxID=1284197 RepID=S8C1Z8_DACHA|nr:hypothetical protein H072_268 [Dactylellina haptotyla CBS 200.50]